MDKRSGGVFVYVVDDDEAVGRSIHFALTAFGWKVKVFNSGQACLNAATECSPICIVADMEMPGMSGTQLQEALLEEHFRIPMVIVTGGLTHNPGRRSWPAGIREIISKPFIAEDLNRAVRDAVTANGGPERRP